MEINPNSHFTHLVELCQQSHEATRQHALKAINKGLVVRNFLFGLHIVEFEQNGQDRAQYGTSLLQELSKTLTSAMGRGFSVDSLEQMRRFYLIYGTSSLPENSETPSRSSVALIPETLSRILSKHSGPSQIEQFLTEISSNPLSIPLSWSHYVVLLSITDPGERRFYEIEATANDWSLRELKRQLDSSLYERLALSRDKDAVRKLSEKGQLVASPADLIKNPYILEFLSLDEKAAYSENDLETAIINKLEHFLLELGKGFLFEARQKRFTFDEDHYFVDLVFYNRLLKCYTLIDLKIGEIAHQDLGQMQMYVNYFDRHVKTPSENPTIGIVLCKRKKDALVEITLPKNSNIHASEYKLYLPSKQELKAQIEQVKIINENQRGKGEVQCHRA
jgi:predicted nuclease of restriction endonuclease-like (RecB) superfamily